MDRQIRTIERSGEETWKFLKEMYQVVMGNIEKGNLKYFKTREDGVQIPNLHIAEGKKIDYHVGWNEPLYAESPETDKRFLEAFEDLSRMPISERDRWNVKDYCVIKEGDGFKVYSGIESAWGKAAPVFELGKYDITPDKNFRKMIPGEFEFETADKVLFDEGYEIRMSPEELVKTFAGTRYESNNYRLIGSEKELSSPNLLYSDKFYSSFKSIEEIADEYGIDYKTCFLKNLLPEEIEVVKKYLGIEDLSQASIEQLQQAIDTRDQSAEHIPSEIAEGIEPTQTGMDKVTDEMIATQSEKNNPDKGEKPGEEPGDN